MIDIREGDCVEVMKNLSDHSVDAVITSPPYNLNIAYATYQDNIKDADYLTWTGTWMSHIRRVLKPDGSFFLNVSGSPRKPWIPFDVASVARQLFTLQNHIAWVKSVHVGDKTYGHFKPLNSHRFLNDTHEHIFHFTNDGDVKINRLAIGVPFSDVSNIKRWKHGKDRRCRGNSWFIPYPTVQSRDEKGRHPAVFPPQLAEYCIRLQGVEEDGWVLDPFGGTGSTAVAAKAVGVNCVLIELDHEYILTATERLKDENSNSH